MNLRQHRFWKKTIVYSVALLALPVFSTSKPDNNVYGIELAQDDEIPPPPPPPPPTEEENFPEEAPAAYAPPPPSSSRSEKSAPPLGKEEKDTAAAEKALRYKEPPLVPISDKERAENCRKHENQFISFHDQVFFVKNCKKFLLSSEVSAKLSTKNIHPKDVITRVIASLGEGGDYNALDTRTVNCKKFNRNYVTFNLKYYWIEDCKLREFPDAATLQDHKWKNRLFDKTTPVLEEAQFKQFKTGAPFASVLNNDQTIVNSHITTLPLQDACRNIRGPYVTYLDSIYMIRSSKNGKGCWREKVDASEMSRKQNIDIAKFRELSSDQALSIPESDPSVVKK